MRKLAITFLFLLPFTVNAQPLGVCSLMTENLIQAVNDAGHAIFCDNGQITTNPGSESAVQDIINTWDEAAAVLAAEANKTQSNRDRVIAEYDENTEIGMRVRALIELFNKRDNYLVNRLAELQAALTAVKNSSGPADNIRNAIPSGWLATNTRTRPEAVTDYRDAVGAGTVDP